MTRVLDVLALPRGEQSRTRKLHDAFFRGLKGTTQNLSVTELEVGREPEQLPVFDEWDISAKFEIAYGTGDLSLEQAERWDRLSKLTDQLHQSQIIVVSCPMWNFSIPWQLKRWIDCVVQGRLTFEYVDGQYRGLLAGRRAVLLVTRDAGYEKGSPLASLDFQLPYLHSVLGFMGITEIDEVVAEGLVAMNYDPSCTLLDDAVRRAEELGARLGEIVR